MGDLMLVFFYDDSEYEETVQEDRIPFDAFGSPVAGAVPASPSTIEVDIKKILKDKKRGK
jgi:hypothetical protein